MFFCKYKLRKIYVIIAMDESSGAYYLERAFRHKCEAENRKRFLENQGLSASIEETMMEVEQ